ncbi:EAL domain-containing protein [Halomonas organivorans]|uniref:Diguanylate cyclase (GGDEF)-like protein n=1 Tax=Halomonas organivorans TaxID=257772 RepID=A0A7W5G6D1_9GAMM|nr:EAL domain-containing protein [Halomonas organivorans]MBB3142069.1 diguanylate cyclase (GGDEF)-like protein [Halomonas organivorans]
MSLIKQLWLIIVGLVLLSFGASLFIGVTTSRAYIEQEVRIKNADNANALALTLTQMPKDAVTIELLIAAQFDTGYYRRIELRSPDGEIIESRRASDAIGDVPAWFVSLVDFDVAPGVAMVQDGWQQFGTLSVESQHSYAYRSLWRSTWRLAGWFTLAGLASLLLGGLLVRSIRQPLHRVVEQARNIGMRRFTTSRVPRTRELGEVVEAMNQLAGDVGDMLGRESQQLDSLRRRLQHDAVTGALNRDAFLAQLQIHLESQDFRASGCLALVRVGRLGQLNETLGHDNTDALLRELADSLGQLAQVHGSGLVGRLNGSDFALLLAGLDDREFVQRELTARLDALAGSREAPIALHGAIDHYVQGDRRRELLSGLDGALSQIERDAQQGLTVVDDDRPKSLFTTHAEWREALQTAIREGVQLAHYPVLDPQGKLLHYECPSRLRLRQRWQPAGTFIPWVSRLGLDVALDLAVVDAALQNIAHRHQATAINLSPASIRDGRFVLELHARLGIRPEASRQLWLELPGQLIIQELDGFRSLCRELRPMGCQLGLKNVGAEFTHLADLHDLGLAFLKIDSSLVKGVQETHERQTILRGMATLCHSLGILAVAEGVETQDETHVLFQLGFDGVTGPGVNRLDTFLPPSDS